MSQHGKKNATQFTQNQNNQMSEDPGDGSRESFVLGRDGRTPPEKAPEGEAQDQEAIEAFGRQGAGSGEQE